MVKTTRLHRVDRSSILRWAILLLISIINKLYKRISLFLGMRIAFVGKGGSGKTTLAALFSQFLREEKVKNIVSIDADINVHLPDLLLGREFPRDKFLSNSLSIKKIKEHLIGENQTTNLEAFRKTTPPKKTSNLIYLEDSNNQVIRDFSIENDGIRLMAVGTYDSEGIGASCYHNNLSILENILTHSVDKKGAIVLDMVAGTDAFASSLHAQFDIIILVVEPTKRGVDVFKYYNELGTSAKIDKDIFVIGNKITSEKDKAFLIENIPSNKLLGFFSSSEYIKDHDKEGGIIELNKLEYQNKDVLIKIFETLLSNIKDPNERLKKIQTLHKKYVSQKFIKDRFGDLTKQIDPEFKFK